MRILQSGIAKSGNYWVYTTLKYILDASGIEFKSFIKMQPIYNVAKTWNLSQNNQSEIDVLEITPFKITNKISNIYEMPIDNLDQYLSISTITWTHSNFYFKCIPVSLLSG